jgi:hypothetical protein
MPLHQRIGLSKPLSQQLPGGRLLCALGRSRLTLRLRSSFSPHGSGSASALIDSSWLGPLARRATAILVLPERGRARIVGVLCNHGVAQRRKATSGRCAAARACELAHSRGAALSAGEAGRAPSPVQRPRASARGLSRLRCAQDRVARRACRRLPVQCDERLVAQRARAGHDQQLAHRSGARHSRCP